MQRKALQKFTKARIFILASYFIVLSILLVRVCYSHVVGQQVTYSVTDYLVNYEGGFVRRGLAGHILFKLAESNIADPQNIILAISIFSYLTFVFYNFWQICKIRKLNNLSLLIFLFSPSLTLFPLNDTAAFERKEILFLPLLVLHLFSFSVRSLETYKILSFLLVSILGSIFILIHEGLFFLGMPISLALVYTRISPTLGFHKSIRLLLLYLIFPSIALFASTIFSGNFLTASKICQSWLKYINNLSCEPLPGAIGWLTKNISSLSDSPPGYQAKILWIFLFLIVILLNLYAIRNSILGIITNKINANSNFITFYLLPIFFSLPLYFIALDWGRWFFFTSATATACLLNQSVAITIQNSFDLKSTPLAKASLFSDFCLKIFNLRIFKPIVLILLPLLLFVQIPHYPFFKFPPSVLYTGSVPNVITLIVKGIQKFYKRNKSFESNFDLPHNY